MAYRYTSEDGKTVITSEQELTDTELEEAFGRPAVEGDYRAEAARKGLASFPSMVYGAFKGALTGGGQTGARQAVEEARRAIMGTLGGTGAKPQTTGQKIVATGIEAAADPTSYLFGAPKILQSAPMLGRAGYQAFESMLGGMGSEVGGMVGEKAEQKLGGEGTTGRVIGSLFGGAGGGMLAGTGARVVEPAKEAYKAFGPKVKQLIGTYEGRTPQDEIQQAASRAVENVFFHAAVSDPNFARVIDEALKAQEATGIKLPLNALLADNKVIDTAIASLASRDPAFREKYFSQYQAAKDALRGKSERLFGAPGQADVTLAANIKDIDPMRAVQRRRAALDVEAQRVSKEFGEVDPAEFGAKVVKITEDAESKARAAVSPLYDNALLVVAPERGVELSEQQVKDIYDTVAGQQASDVFKTFPSIYRKVKSAFAPTEGTPQELVSETGDVLASWGKQTFKKATVEDLDSLKREINLQIRKAGSASDLRVLSDLRQKVSETINSLDPVFVEAYRKADEAFLQKVGLPFNEESIRQIGRAKFDENVVPVLTRNKSALSQFLSATGAPGKELAEQAFVSDLAKAAVKDGKLNPAAANAWLRRNDSALALVPDVKARVEQASRDVTELLNQQKALSDKFVNQAASRILKLEGMGAQQIVENMYKSRDFTEKFMRQHGNDPDNLKAIRSFLLDDVVSSPNPLATLSDRTKASIYNRVFGPTYSDKVRQLAVISDRITRDPSAVAPNLRTIPKGRIEEAIGAPPEMIISRFTNPVMSTFYAFSSLMSRFLNRRVSAETDAEMKRILLDPQASAQLFKSITPRVEDFRAKEMADEVTALGKRLGINFKDMLLRDVGTGASRAPKAWDEEEQPQEVMQ